MSELRYGIDSSLSLELPGDTIVARCDAPRGTPVTDVAAAVDNALAEPLGFPALSLAVVPLDKVVLALAAGVPQAHTVIERTVRVLIANGVRAADITLVRAEALETLIVDAGETLTIATEDGDAVIAATVHDPHHRDSLSYLAASAGGHPIYINRAIHDADLVISIGCLRLADALGYHGVHGDIFPTFSDAASISRYQSAKESENRRKRLAARAGEVSWLLGASFTIQVVPGRRDEVLHVLAGEPAAVLATGNRLSEEAWRFCVPRPVSLVIATIEGASEQTWTSVGRALAASAAALDVDGSVVLCTELADRPGVAFERLIGAEDLDEALVELDKHRSADAPAAAELARALQRGKVYLISGLHEEFVEDLGISPLAPGQLSRIAGHFESCVVLTNAQHAIALTSADDVPDPRPASRSTSRK